MCFPFIKMQYGGLEMHAWQCCRCTQCCTLNAMNSTGIEDVALSDMY